MRFEVADVRALPYADEFDAVVSNAALHWVRDQQSAIASIAKALKHGGRLVFEMGGLANLRQALARRGVPARCARWASSNPEQLSPVVLPVDWGVRSFAGIARALTSSWRCISIGQPSWKAATAGSANWIEMFGGFALSAVTSDQRQELFRMDRTSSRAGVVSRWRLDHRLQAPSHGRYQALSPTCISYHARHNPSRPQQAVDVDSRAAAGGSGAVARFLQSRSRDGRSRVAGQAADPA